MKFIIETPITQKLYFGYTMYQSKYEKCRGKYLIIDIYTCKLSKDFNRSFIINIRNAIKISKYLYALIIIINGNIIFL